MPACLLMKVCNDAINSVERVHVPRVTIFTAWKEGCAVILVAAAANEWSLWLFMNDTRCWKSRAGERMNVSMQNHACTHMCICIIAHKSLAVSCSPAFAWQTLPTGRTWIQETHVEGGIEKRERDSTILQLVLMFDSFLSIILSMICDHLLVDIFIFFALSPSFRNAAGRPAAHA